MVIANPPYQFFPDLPDEDYQALKRDIAEHGVMVPVEYDEAGNVLDGHHRLRALEELGREGVTLPPPPSVVREGLTEREKRQHVRRLNILRRHLTREQIRELIRDQVHETPERSNRQIAGALGVDDKTVGTVRRDMESGAEIPHLERVTGPDGKSYPRHQPQPRRAPDPEIADDYVDAVNQDPDYQPTAEPLPRRYEPTQPPRVVFTPATEMPVTSDRSDRRAQAQAEAEMTQRVVDFALDQSPEHKQAVARAELLKQYHQAMLGARELLRFDPEALVRAMDRGDRSAIHRFVGDARSWMEQVEHALSKGVHLVKAEGTGGR